MGDIEKAEEIFLNNDTKMTLFTHLMTDPNLSVHEATRLVASASNDDPVAVESDHAPSTHMPVTTRVK